MTSKPVHGQDELQRPIVVTSTHEFKTRKEVGWYTLRAHEYGVNREWVARRKRQAEKDDDEPFPVGQKQRKKKPKGTKKS